MITLIEAKNYRCLQYIRQPLGPFHVLVGPNASGKTTFLDVVAFLKDFLSGGLDEAIVNRTQNFSDLIWGRQGDGFELAVEVAARDSEDTSFTGVNGTLRYEVSFGADNESNAFVVKHENLFLLSESSKELNPRDIPESIINSVQTERDQIVFARKAFQSGFGSWGNQFPQYFELFEAGPRDSLLRNLPIGEPFELPNALKYLVSDHLRPIDLDSIKLRRASRRGQGNSIKADGSNLPWVVEALRSKDIQSYRRWIAHLKTALPDLVDIDTVERDDDRHRYLYLCYEGGLRVPSWMASDGTLRLVALTLIAYLPDIQGVYLIEEPENGIHPCAIETMYQSLSSVYDAQVLLATHSPVILSVADVSDVLCFSKTAEGAAEIVSGDEHPALINWHGETNLGVLFAGGVLG